MKTPKQLAMEYMEGIDFSNNTGIYIVNEMQGTAYQGYLDGYNALKEETKDILIRYTKNLRDYERESHNMIGFDERDDEEFVDIFLKANQDENSRRNA